MKEFYRIQNSMIGVISLIQNFRKGNLTIQYVKATNPKKPSEIKKGDKIYDYKNSNYFSISLKETQMLLEYLSQAMKSGFKTAEFELTHFPKGGVHKLVLTGVPEKSRLLFQLVYLENKSVKSSIKLMFDKYDVYVLIDFLKSHSIVKSLANYNQDINFLNNQENKSNNTSDFNKNNKSYNNNTNSYDEPPPPSEQDATSFFGEEDIF